MPRMGDLAATDVYNVPVDPLAEGGSNVMGGILNATGNVARGLYRDIPRAAQWFYGQAGKPEAEAQADTRNVMGGLAQQMYTLPQRALGASQEAIGTGTYNPAPAVETALTVMAPGMAIGREKGGVALGSGPIRAYHSSPHDFDKFDLAKIGTGEGAQVYGHGLYFAENPAVSGQGGEYWKQFMPRFGDNELSAAKYLQQKGFDRDAAVAALQRDMEAVQKRARGSPGDFHQRVLESQQAQLDLLRSDKPVGPRTYEVNINADPAHMLDWDKAIKGQSDFVKKTLWNAAPYLATGGERQMGMLAGSPLKEARTATQLREAGIPGIKYLDEGSRNMVRPTVARNTAMGDIPILEPDLIPKKTHNYVIWDPNIIDIRKKYGIAGAVGAGGMGALAAQDRYEQ